MQPINIVSEMPVHPTKKAQTRRLDQIKQIIVHTTDWDIEPKALTEYDIGPNHISSTGCPTCTYHFYINQEGTSYQLVDLHNITWHAAMHNSNSVAICLAYKTDPAFESGKAVAPKSTKNVPSDKMILSLKMLLAQLCVSLQIEPTKIFGHRELVGTGFILVKGHKRLRKTCLLPDNRILTGSGYKNIQDITISDKIRGPISGELQSVTKTTKTKISEEIYKVSFNYDNFWPVKLTGDHEVLSWKSPLCHDKCVRKNCNPLRKTNNKSHNKNICSKINLSLSEIVKKTGFTQVQDLKLGDYLAVPLGNYTNTSLESQFSKEVAYLAGWYLAEGFKYQNNSVRLTLNAKTESAIAYELGEIALKNGFKYHLKTVNSCIVLTINNSFYEKVIKYFVKGNDSLSKSISEDLMNSNVEYQKSFLNGYIKGDGSEDSRRYRVSTSSEELAHQIFILIARQGFLPSKVLGRKKRVHIIEGRKVNANQEFSIEYSKSKTVNNGGFLTKEYFYIPISSIEKEEYSGLVYDISVENDKCYFTNSIVTHNCPGMAVSLQDLRTDVIMAIQSELKDEGFYTGSIDGQWGPRSKTGFVELCKLVN